MALALTGQGGEFVNLRFDEPDLSHARLWTIPWLGITRLYAPVDEAFRGWTVECDVRWDYTEGMVPVIDGSSPFGLSTRIQEPYGQYIVGVTDRYGQRIYERPELSLSQTGSMPKEPSALIFYQVGGGSPDVDPPDAPVRVLVNGVEQTVMGFPLGCGIDCSPFAGQQAEVKFVFHAGRTYLFDVFGFMPLPDAPTPVIIRQIAVGGGQLVLSWTGPSSRYQVQQKAALDHPWENLGEPVTQTSWTNAITAPLGFFRVVGLPE
jgi:hypothetical protein